MSGISRRKLLTTGLTAVAGVSGLAAAAKLAGRDGLIPPDAGTLFGAGGTLTYAAQRILMGHAGAREFDRRQISTAPFANPVDPPLDGAFGRLQAAGFADWRIDVDGMVARPASFSLAELRSFPQRTQITEVACEEGWSYIAEWTGVPLAHILERVDTHPQARYVLYRSIQKDWWDSIDMADALHPQTILTLAMNGTDLPVPFGGPVRLRLPRQLGYKSIKYIVRLTLTDDLKKFGSGLGSSEPDLGYSWYAGI
ncbi:MAG: molybdopterin-dependent oxidoreductase [Acidobacteriota bacterium]|nr:molybdopterin-dependent oxidoreductase [Acidobacteriota bacterium]